VSAPPEAPAVLITGAAGTLGNTLVSTFATAGWTVFAGVHRTPLPVACTGCIPIPLDVADTHDWSRAAGVIGRHVPFLHALIHNAGISEDSLLASTSVEAWDRTAAVNLRPAALGTREFLPLLRSPDGSHLVLVSSLASRVGGAGQTAYSSSKAALIGLAQSLARELAPERIRVNTIFPGALRGSMTEALSPAARQRLIEANLLQTLNDPMEVARFIAFLVTTRNISGQVFHLDSRISSWT
jgi:NAD(P)-dependent dehydrogenase (short-subunit alcohol dehydrogenase family)